jgi:cell wall assembly regulator SMI1
MYVHWQDLDLLDEGILSWNCCYLDPATGRFTANSSGHPLLAGVQPQALHSMGRDEGSLDPSRDTLLRTRYVMLELRERRACANGLADPALTTRLLRILDEPGSPEQRAALTAYIAAKKRPRDQRELGELVERVAAEDPEGALSWCDDHEFALLRIAAFDRALRSADPEARSRLSESLHQWNRSDLWAWSQRLPDPAGNPPPWLPEVLAWRAQQAEARRVRVAGLLARLDAWLAGHAPAVHAQLRPGADAGVLDACEQALGRPLPPTLRQLWGWHDGGGELMPVAFVYSLRSVEEMLAMRAQRHGWWADAPGWWGPGWLPILEDPSGNVIAVDLDGDFTGTPAQMIGFWHDSEDRDIVAHDLESMLEILVSIHESGAIGTDEHGLDGVSQWDWKMAARRLTGTRGAVFRATPPRDR